MLLLHALAVRACLDEPLQQHVDIQELVCLAAVLDVAAERTEKVRKDKPLE